MFADNIKNTLFFSLTTITLIIIKFSTTVAIPLPTPAQLRYQDTDFVALIHFNMGTYAHNGDPCCDKSNWNIKASYAAGKTNDPATFNPKLLNTSQWMDSVQALGAKIAILTAKHGCGFGLWPTQSRLPDGSPYNYNVGSIGAAIKIDVLKQFVHSANAYGIGYGFYYSIMKNFYLCRDYSGADSCMNTTLHKQHNFTQDEYLNIVRAQVTELWTNYGDLTEIWVDSELGGMEDLMVRLQPQAVGTPKNPTGWCGTESGHPSVDVGPADVWSIGDGFFGNPNSDNWLPKFCDPQLFQEHVWFWEPNLKVRNLTTMIPIYHDIVGRGMVMELAFSINRDGLVEDTHAVVYKQLGDWVRTCYGTPVSEFSAATPAGLVFDLDVPAGSVIDRVQLKEDIVMGQRVRKYTLAIAQNSSAQWKVIFTGYAIGTKRIVLLNITFTAVASTRCRLSIESAVAPPIIKQFAIFSPCTSQ